MECNSWNNLKQLLYTLHFCKKFKEAFVLRYKEFGDFLRNCMTVLGAHCPQTRVAVLALCLELSFKLLTSTNLFPNLFVTVAFSRNPSVQPLWSAG